MKRRPFPGPRSWPFEVTSLDTNANFLLKAFSQLTVSLNMAKVTYRIDLYIGPASVDWTSLTASKETGLEDVMLGVEVWLENMNESQYK